MSYRVGNRIRSEIVNELGARHGKRPLVLVISPPGHEGGFCRWQVSYAEQTHPTFVVADSSLPDFVPVYQQLRMSRHR